jgi:DUF1680 family protein
VTRATDQSVNAETTHAAVVVDTRQSPFVRLRPLSLDAVTIDDTFWAPRRRVNHAVTLPEQYAQLEQTGRLHNLRRAAGQEQGAFEGRFFNDSDVYKWLEAAAWVLATERDERLQAQVDDLIALIAAAQDADGYLDTYFTFARVPERWTDLAVMHELYCAGHLIQAAVAHHRARGRRDLLDVAVRLADHIVATFNPMGRQGADGHPEIEMALVELSRDTGDERYRHQAQFFVDQRGQHPPTISGKEYHQDHAPVRAQHEVVGHAVRALYLYAGMTDLYAETGEQALWEALDTLWRNLQGRKIYITGGAGARHEGEAFGDDYELPNRRAYAETCAAIAHVMWAWRLLLVTGEACYGDALETALYNGVLSGISLDGETYFYENPLADRGNHRRQPWFGTACCPPNVARLLASLPGYVYTTSDKGLWVHLYATGTATAALTDVGVVTLRQQTNYPWDGEITLTIDPPDVALFSLFLRVPKWAEGASVTVNDEVIGAPVRPGHYMEIRRQWAQGDVIRLTLPLAVRLLSSHPYVINNRDRVALVRGPLVYCVEAADHPGVDPWDLVLSTDAAWRVEREPDLLGGIMVLRTEDARARVDDGWEGQLYRSFDTPSAATTRVPLTAIPYYVWANRDAGPMQVWLPIATNEPASS